MYLDMKYFDVFPEARANPEIWKRLKNDQKRKYLYFAEVYEHIERVHRLHRKGYIPEDEWKGYVEWAIVMFEDRLFSEVHDWFKGYATDEFVDFMHDAKQKALSRLAAR
jgi:hypothetical protein